MHPAPAETIEELQQKRFDEMDRTMKNARLERLRDEMAIAAMNALIIKKPDGVPTIANITAEDAYKYADAMLNARARFAAQPQQGQGGGDSIASQALDKISYASDQMREQFDDDWKPKGNGMWRLDEFAKWTKQICEAIDWATDADPAVLGTSQPDEATVERELSEAGIDMTEPNKKLRSMTMAYGALAFLKRLRGVRGERGCIVSSADCSHAELVQAQACKRFFVDDESMGYVHRSGDPGGRVIERARPQPAAFDVDAMAGAIANELTSFDHNNKVVSVYWSDDWISVADARSRIAAKIRGELERQQEGSVKHEVH